MQAILEGKFMEQKHRTSKKTGEVIPLACIYSGGEIVEVVNCDFSEVDFGTDVKLPVLISSGQYGLYVRANVEEDREGV